MYDYAFYENNEELQIKIVFIAINKSFWISSDPLWRSSPSGKQQEELNEKSHRNCSCGIAKASRRRRARAVFTRVRVPNAETFLKVHGKQERRRK